VGRYETYSAAAPWYARPCWPAPDWRRDIPDRLHGPDGDDLGEAGYAQQIFVAEEIIAGRNQHYRVVDLVEFDEEEDALFVGLLQVEAA